MESSELDFRKLVDKMWKKENIGCDMRLNKTRTLKDAREENLAAKDARRFRKWESSNMLRIQHEHSQETMAGHDFGETSQRDMHNSVSGYVQRPQSAHLWKNGLPIQPGVLEYYQLPPASTSNSPTGTLPPGFCQSHLQKDNKNTACPVMVNPDEAANTMIVSHNVSVGPNRPDTSGETDPGHNTDSVYVQNAESAPFESGFPFQRETSGRAEVILDMPEDDHLPRITSMAASVQPYCSTLPPNSSQSPATPLLVAQNVLVELSGPDTSNEMEVESQMYDHDDSTLPLPGNQDAVASTTMIVALNVPSDQNEPNASYTMETESQVHDKDDPDLPLPVNQGTIATHSYFGIEVNMMLAGINGTAIVELDSFAPKNSSLKQVFAAALGIGFFGSLFATLCRRKLKQATILSNISVIATSSAILVALGTQFAGGF